MARALGLAIALLLLAASPAGALDGPTGDLVAGSEETVLRLHDLPPGYQIGDDSGCGPFFPFGEGQEPEGRLEQRYLRWVVDNWPEGCFYEYEQLFKVPGLGPAPPQVEVETLNTPSEEAAAQGWRIYTELLKRSSSDGERDQAGNSLIWRQGKLLAFLTVSGWGPRRADRALARFAQTQQWRLEHPSPYTEAERDDSEVRLDDPGLKFPVYWVGNPFQAGGGPAVELEEAAVKHGPAGQKYQLDYEILETNGFIVGGWTRRSWQRFQRSGVGKANRTARCTRKTEVELARGSAVIYGSYAGRRRRPCPRRSPDHYYAIAHIGRMVIGVNLGNCLSCPPGGSAGFYNTLSGMKMLVRALHVRPKPVY